MSEVNNTLLMQKLVNVLEKQQQEAERITRDSGGSNGGNMESRIAKLESDVGHISGDIKEIKTDLRVILGIAIGTYLAIASCYLLLADKLEKQVDRIERAVSAKQGSK